MRETGCLSWRSGVVLLYNTEVSTAYQWEGRCKQRSGHYSPETGNYACEILEIAYMNEFS